MEKIFYPATQRRLKADAHIRKLTASVKLSHKSFIQPLFVDEASEALAEKNLVNRKATHLEVWTALTGAGVDIIISYASKNAKTWIGRMEY